MSELGAAVHQRSLLFEDSVDSIGNLSVLGASRPLLVLIL